MKIAYGVHGYGRGHSIRSKAIINKLDGWHEVKVVTGGDALDLLSHYDPYEVPVLEFRYRGGKLSVWNTVKANKDLVWDLLSCGPVFSQVKDFLASYKPDFVISDSEPFVLKAARQLGIPTIMMDHFGVMVYCDLQLSFLDELERAASVMFYRMAMGHTDYAIGSAFYQAPVYSLLKHDRLKMVGSILTDEVKEHEPTDAGHILMYINKGRKEVVNQVLTTLTGINRKIKIYPGQENKSIGNIEYCKVDRYQFLEDLASCSLLITTAGNQLMGECLYYGKPVIVIPEPVVEQRINGTFVERIGMGWCTTLQDLEPGVINAALLRGGKTDRKDYAEIAYRQIEKWMRSHKGKRK